MFIVQEQLVRIESKLDKILKRLKSSVTIKLISCNNYNNYFYRKHPVMKHKRRIRDFCQ